MLLHIFRHEHEHYNIYDLIFLTILLNILGPFPFYRRGDRMSIIVPEQLLTVIQA